ncbi:tetratricopeptide repeat protein [Actinoplanes sp. NPDC051411]|uniref:AfsR/SARP family transcriptional regulator n=1 Tax=Actinoplanes sp. NPDC051411 TaxID=3155522 RepID=UPI003437AE18
MWTNRRVMQFRLLGRVEASRDGVPVPLGRRRERLLLGLLLLEPGVPVPVGRLASLLWDDEPPATARMALNTHVSRLRAVLDPHGDGASGIRLVSRDGGYLAEVDTRAVDVHEFRALVERAREQADPAARSALMRDALALWRGPLLAEVASDRIRERVGAQLAQLRLTALEDRFDAELAAGRHRGVLGELADLVLEQPLHERFAAQLMRALWAAGRPGEALKAFESTRRVLAEELGTDPGPELRELHGRLLRGEAPRPEPASPPARRVTAGPGNYLPGDVADFTGREAEVAQLLAMLPATAGTAVVVSAIDGMAGIGKTALAVHAAHRLTDRYPDAQLFLDLHAHTVGRGPVDPHSALDTLLRALGVESRDIPDGLDDRAARWRAELAQRRALIVLDNAANAAQVRPLMPGSANCLALITSRRRLTDLDGARTIPLDVLPPADAASLFAQVVGDDRGATGAPETAVVVRLCGFLPLAIRIAAARLRSRPVWTARDLADRLRGEHRRLAELSTGDRSVAGAFLLSYQQLSPARQSLFRRLGLHPGADVDAHAAAALAGIDPDDAERHLEYLVDVHLLDQTRAGRYRPHDLLRHFAADLARREEPEADRRQSVTRLLDYYLHGAHVACGQLDRRGQRVTIALTDPPRQPATRSSFADALAWCDAERANLISATHHAAEHGWPTHAWQLPVLLWEYFRVRGSYRESLALHEVALTAATDLGDHQAWAEIQRDCGITSERLGRYAEAADRHRQALARYRQIGDERGAGATLANLGVVQERLGRYHDAIDHYQQSLVLRRKVGDEWGEGSTLSSLGLVYERLGKFSPALDHHQQALALRRKTGDKRGEGATLTCIGMVYERLGRYEEALDHHQQALVLMRAGADTQGEGAALGNLGNVYRNLGRYREACEHHEHSLATMRKVGDRNSESEVLNDLGETYLAMGSAARAVSHHEAALALAREVHVRPQEARAHNGIARARRETDPGDARDHWRQALDIYLELEVPEADEVRRRLDELDR